MSSLSDLLIPPDQVQALTHVRMGIYGPNGAGKTTFASTIPDSERVLYISVDDENIRPVAHLKHFRIIKVRRWDQLLVVYQGLVHQKGITTVVWDTWSRIQDLAVGKVTGYEPSDPNKLVQYINSIPKSPQGWAGWGQVGALCSEWQRNFNMLPMHMLYLLQEQDRRREVEQDVYTAPRLTPEALKGIRDSLEILGRLYVDLAPQGDSKDGDVPSFSLDGPAADRIDPNVRETRRLFIGQHERYIAKGPTHILGRIIDDPTWPRVVQPLFGSRNGAR